MAFDPLLSVLKKFPFQKIRQKVFSNWAETYVFFLKLVKDTDLGTAFLDRIKEIDDLQVYDDRTLVNCGSSASMANWDTLAGWLVWRASKTSAEETINDLFNYLNTEYNEGYEVLAISGIKTDACIKLFDDIYLKPLSEIPDSPIKNEFYPDFPPPISYCKPNVESVLYREAKFKPKFLKQDHSFETTEGTKQAEMFNTCLCFTLLKGASPLPIIHFSGLADKIPCSQFLGSGGGKEIFDVIQGPEYKLKNEDVNILGKIIKNFMRLKKKDKAFYGLVIRRLGQSKRRADIADKALDLGIALETVLLKDLDDTRQLRLTFRLRGAWLLARNSEERNKYFYKLGKIYDLRSAAAHSGEIKCKNKTDRKSKEKLLNEGFEIASKIILKLMNIERLNWNRIILGRK